MTSLDTIIALDQQYYMPTFGARIPLLFSRGEGCYLFDQAGQSYLDFLAGIATNSLGYAHPIFTQTLHNQVDQVLHLSNYFYNEPQALLAQKLCQETCADRVFFCNSGGEANEGALKLARKYFFNQDIDRYEIIATTNSFHGRTIATVTATGQEKYKKPYAPLVGGIVHVPFGDICAMEHAINDHTAAILVEPIQGEGGVIAGGQVYLQALRKLCDDYGIFLIFDEVQTGMGRTGKLFAHQYYQVEPDIFTVAKALGNGLPIGAICCKAFCSSFGTGDHGTTFGGNPFCTAGALCVTNIISDPAFLDHVTNMGQYLKSKLLTTCKQYLSIIHDIRGVGLLLGVAFHEQYPVSSIKDAFIQHHILVGTAGQNVLRLAPPLIVTETDIDSFVRTLQEILADLSS